ncbi:unnamed protein product [Pseudo-nitzschia multistriata]|uniref:Uncharacterized protein n=1 Tax=Pseudo-nitzschia multistriata TaxID=183589 RepID=A0A448ZFS4_9STRA|nr:unnamed protein product [Pseudo-nitzschia multistriata]
MRTDLTDLDDSTSIEFRPQASHDNEGSSSSSFSKLPGCSLVKATGADDNVYNNSSALWKSNHTVVIEADDEEEGSVDKDNKGGSEKQRYDEDEEENVSKPPGEKKSTNQKPEKASPNWFQKILGESAEQKAKRIAEEKAMAKQNASNWGRDITDDDDDDDDDSNNSMEGEQNTKTSTSNKDHKSITTAQTAGHTVATVATIGTALATFWEHTKAIFDDPDADPELRKLIETISRLRAARARQNQSNSSRIDKSTLTSIKQQHRVLQRKLGRTAFRYRRDPFAACIREVYRPEILEVVHGRVPEDEEKRTGDDIDLAPEQDAVDKLLDSNNFDYGYAPEDEEKDKENASDEEKSSPDDESDGRDNSNRSVEHSSLIPLETRLLRAQHNEWMTQNQMDLARKVQKEAIEYLSLELLPELKQQQASTNKDDEEQSNDHDLYAMFLTPVGEWKRKIDEAKASNESLREAYKAHLAAQEKLLAAYREQCGEENEIDENGSVVQANENGATAISPLPSPVLDEKRKVRPVNWAKNLQTSVRSLLAPPKLAPELITDEAGEDTGDVPESIITTGGGDETDEEGGESDEKEEAPPSPPKIQLSIGRRSTKGVDKGALPGRLSTSK